MPLIGFAGAPFTVASYLVEGGPTRTWAATKAADVRRRAALARRCSTASPTWPRDSLRSQVVAGAQAIQLFDSWAGQLSPSDYRALRAAALGAKVLQRRWPTSACHGSTSASAPASCWS